MVESSRLRMRKPCLRPSSSASGALGSGSAPSPLGASSCEGRGGAGVPQPSQGAQPGCHPDGRARSGSGWHQVTPTWAPHLLLAHRGDDRPHVIAAGKLEGRYHLGPDALLEGQMGVSPRRRPPAPTLQHRRCPPAPPAHLQDRQRPILPVARAHDDLQVWLRTVLKLHGVGGEDGAPPAAPRPPCSPCRHLFREEGRLAHGSVGTGSDVEDAVTHLRAPQRSGGRLASVGDPSAPELTSKE